ncbi:hypothetical protein M758_4G250600 [Ceratodon purpureus]|nr:hypothetical protein M758_4G250600 [Ceratodon purpureus]
MKRRKREECEHCARDSRINLLSNWMPVCCHGPSHHPHISLMCALHNLPIRVVPLTLLQAILNLLFPHRVRLNYVRMIAHWTHRNKLDSERTESPTWVALNCTVSSCL